ncbi:VWA domain-containing protein [Solimonas terrae]|uniref:VWA domain-containing protein n=1 Tax=Solimonas terrae TaxID=1396819 RepID=A0A6M2BWP4_9GAMM|nr:VWA domain-containing protein [Solimonas terrae]NGY06814.1 VWA domain-containing protein [Solimonas terrae]
MSTLTSTLQAFHFLRPLWLIALIPAWALCVWLARRQRNAGSWSGVIDAELLASLRLDAGITTRRSAAWPWLALAWTLALLALAGPSWQRDRTTAYRGADAWVLVLDLSPSMSARDVSPDRVTRARYAIDDLLGAAHGARVSLVVFSDEAYTVTPLTDDIATVRTLLPPLAPELMPTRGDSLAPALAQADKLLDGVQARAAHVVVFTDGFADPAAAFAAAAKLRARGARLDVVGIGTRDGAPVSADNGGFEQDDHGRPALARLDTARLQQLATAGGGRYTDQHDMPALLAGLQSQHESFADAVDQQDVQVQHWRDGGIWLLPPLLLLGLLLSRRGWL